MTREAIGGVWEMLFLKRQAFDDLLLVLISKSVPNFLSLWTEVVPAAGRQLQTWQWSSGGLVDFPDSCVNAVCFTVVMNVHVLEMPQMVSVR